MRAPWSTPMPSPLGNSRHVLQALHLPGSPGCRKPRLSHPGPTLTPFPRGHGAAGNEPHPASPRPQSWRRCGWWCLRRGAVASASSRTRTSCTRTTPRWRRTCACCWSTWLPTVRPPRHPSPRGRAGTLLLAPPGREAPLKCPLHMVRVPTMRQAGRCWLLSPRSGCSG